MDHRPGLLHLLADQKHRPPLRSRSGDPPRVPCSDSTAHLAAASSQVPTRPGGAASQARLWRPRSCSITSG
jgi:hypothetical protein